MATKKTKHNERAEWMNNMTREQEGLREGSKTDIHIDLLKTTLKYMQLENTLPWWDTWFLVQKIHVHFQQTRNEQTFPWRTSTWLDNQKKEHIYPKRTQQRTCDKQYRPITCLPRMWKISTAQMREGLYYSLTTGGLFPEEQKGYFIGPRATVEFT